MTLVGYFQLRIFCDTLPCRNGTLRSTSELSEQLHCFSRTESPRGSRLPRAPEMVQVPTAFSARQQPRSELQRSGTEPPPSGAGTSAPLPGQPRCPGFPGSSLAVPAHVRSGSRGRAGAGAVTAPGPRGGRAAEGSRRWRRPNRARRGGDGGEAA